MADPFADLAKRESAPSPRRITFREVWEILRRRAVVVIAFAAIGVGAASALAFTAKKEYSATSALLFRTTTPTAASALLGGSAAASTPSSDPALDQATELQLVQLDTIARLTAKLVGHNLTADDVAGDVSIGSSTDNVVGITATTPTPSLSAELANAYANQFVEFRQRIDSSAILAAEHQAQTLLSKLPPAEQRGSLGKNLRSQAEQLSVAASLQSGNAEVVQTATLPTTPSSPRKKQDLAAGLILGALWGVLMALLLERFDPRVRNTDEIDAIVGQRALGVIPYSKSLQRGGGSAEALALDSEAFQLLRASLAYLQADPDAHPTRGYPTILVTSAQPADGKTTVCRFLAGAFARAGTRVLLIDADLRRPGHYVRAIGLTQVLAGTASLDDAIITVDAPFSVGDDKPQMDVLPTGPLSDNPQLLASDAIAQILASCESRYELVLVDAPPLTVVADAIPLTQYVSGVLVVVRPGKTERLALRRLSEGLRLVGADVLAVVINGVSRGSAGGYGYGYGYGQRYSKAQSEIMLQGADGVVATRDGGGQS